MVTGLASLASSRVARPLRLFSLTLLIPILSVALVESGYHTVYFTRYFHQLSDARGLADPLYEVLDDPPGLYRLKPGARADMPSPSGKNETATAIINRWGMRDTAFEIDTPENALRLLFVGDSVTFGPGLPFEETFPEKTAVLLSQKLKRPVKAFNFGVPGYNLPELARIRTILPWKDIRPDRVIYAVCLNDAQLDEESYDPATHALVPRHHSSAVLWLVSSLFRDRERELDRLLSQVLENTAVNHAWPIVVLLPSAPYLRGIPKEDALSDRAAATFFRKHLSEKNIETLDLLDLAWPKPVEKNYLAGAQGPDPAHFSARGSRFVAEKLAAFLETRLTE